MAVIAVRASFPLLPPLGLTFPAPWLDLSGLTLSGGSLCQPNEQPLNGVWAVNFPLPH